MKIAITDCDHVNLIQEEAVFEKNGLSFELLQCKTEQDLIDNCKDYNVFLNQYAPFTRKVFEALPNIKHIVRYGVGVNNVDLVAASEHGVQVSNVPDYGMNEVADQAVAMMMALVRKIDAMNDYTKNKDWNYAYSMPIPRIPGKTVGIYGLGRIGQTFAKRMSGFDVKLIATDPRYKLGEVVNGVEIVDFDTLVSASDIISIHAPFDETTKHQFNLEVIGKMKRTAYLINVSRGGIIDEDDLLKALEQKLIRGAALDVVEVEPMKVGHPLFKFENFLITPHMAWYSDESALELKTKTAEEAARFAKGEKIWYPVNEI